MFQFYRLLAAGGLVVLVHAGSAAGAEWTLAADVEQTIQVDDNFGLDKPSEGVLYGSTSAVDLRLGARTKRTQWNLDTGIRLTAFAGSGDDTGLDRSDPKVGGEVIHQGKRFATKSSFQFSRASVASTQFGVTRSPAGSETPLDGTGTAFDDFGTISSDNAIQTLLKLDSKIVFELDAVNELSLEGFGRRERFSGNSTEFADVDLYGTSFGWGHDLTELTSTDLSLQVQRVSTDDLENTEILSLTTTGGFDTKLTPRLTFGLDVGLTVADIQRDPPGRDETPFGVVGGLKVDYELAADTQFSFAAKHGIEPSSLDDLQIRSTFGLLVEHSINERSRVSLLASYSRQAPTKNSTNSVRQLFVLSPDYSIDLTQNWRAEVGYIFRLGDDSGIATSNNVFIKINRTFDLLR